MKNNNFKTIALLFGLMCGILTMSSQVKMPVLNESDFDKSNIQLIVDGQKQLGVISYEYVVINGVGEKMQLLYLAQADSTIDLSTGYKVQEVGKIIFDYTTGLATEEALSETWAGGIFIDQQGNISYQNIDNATIATATPYYLEDVRGEEIELYALVKIGNQVWQRQNMRTALFNNGSAIITGLTKQQWEDTKTPAVTYYDNNIQNRDTMGALYNWYAANDIDNVMPQGWIVPSVADWEELAKYISPQDAMTFDVETASLSYTGGELIKSTTGWEKPNSPTGDPTVLAGNNLTMLNLSPFGSTSTSKYFNGYSGRSHQAYFWTQTQSDQAQSKGMFIRTYWDSQTLNCFYEDKFMGYSIRCIANAPLKIKNSTATTTSIADTKTTDNSIIVKSGVIFLNTSQKDIGNKAILFSIRGTKVLEKIIDSSVQLLDISGLAKGVYILTIGGESHKIII
ncbi:MAG: hypothetical protein CSA89_00520 [Bacteroidales bacterium]|nr:MAG: hypothetical protein CSA89_00520 [Bacteroidales bacterium]